MLKKVLGKIDQGVLPEARHPLVAAYPKIGVMMNKMILSNNFNVTNEQGRSVGQQKSNTISVSTSSSNTEATIVGASVSAEISFFPSLSVSTNISHE